eukprot:CAMPEP_0119327502 /NCGR_PEP_ID=MMETSP1333-20130426/70934_1 /TAXON_ID=418940 /ORGANISM="Scyphosphaera apsteinii, Strain RCC1455" /LENGTH=138 /DNA_ID=CAMNT_0007336111 /DNA_START=212 /DNA_END=628 /DNA_ORIENTATION=-
MSNAELNAAIAEMNAEMADLFGSPVGNPGFSELEMGPGGMPSAHDNATDDADTIAASLAAATASVAALPSSIQATPSLKDVRPSACAAASVLHAKISNCVEELSHCDDIDRATSLAACVKECSLAATALGKPFPPSST